jgi:hypothetical protein
MITRISSVMARKGLVIFAHPYNAESASKMNRMCRRIDAPILSSSASRDYLAREWGGPWTARAQDRGEYGGYRDAPSAGQGLSQLAIKTEY